MPDFEKLREKYAQKQSDSPNLDIADRSSINEYLSKNGLKYELKQKSNGTSLFCLEECLFNSEHRKCSAIGLSPNGKIFYNCFHKSCKGKTWFDVQEKISSNGVSPFQFIPILKTNEKQYAGLEPMPLPKEDEFKSGLEYPIDCLPNAIKEVTNEIARFAKVSQEAPGTVALSCIATAIGKKALVVERNGLEHFPSLFFTIVASSGERKTFVFKTLTNALEIWIEAQKEKYELNKNEAVSRNTTIDTVIKELKRKAKKESDVESISRQIQNLESTRMKTPVYPSLYTTDCTEQKLFQMMDDRGGAYAVMSGEGRPVFDCILGKYSGAGRTGDAIFLSGISGDKITRDRVGGENGPEERSISHPCLNVCIMIQPKKYAEVASHPDLRDSGALARIMAVRLKSLIGSRFEDDDEMDLQEQILKPYWDIIKDILDSGTDQIHRVYLSKDAAKDRQELNNTLESQMGNDGDLDDVSDFASKLTTNVTKIALILHITKQPFLLKKSESEIDLETWAEAKMLATFYFQESIKNQRQADAGYLVVEAKRVLKWIVKKRKAEVTISDLCQGMKRPRPKAKEAEQILEFLTEYKYLFQENRKERRKPIYVVNPIVFNNG